MDTFVDSSWYFLRFADSHNEREAFSSLLANQWMPVDVYVGGVEHGMKWEGHVVGEACSGWGMLWEGHGGEVEDQCQDLLCVSVQLFYTCFMLDSLTISLRTLVS